MNADPPLAERRPGLSPSLPSIRAIKQRDRISINPIIYPALISYGKKFQSSSLTDERRLRVGCGRNNGSLMDVGTVFKGGPFRENVWVPRSWIGKSLMPELMVRKPSFWILIRLGLSGLSDRSLGFATSSIDRIPVPH